jgi:uncharacterized SAM-binding protein YcdF (DUF218 family)
MVINAIRIYNYSDEYFEDESDVAIVLGAGTNNGKISPIYRERVNHSINLYKQGKVDFLIFTGGYGKGQVVSDSEVAKKYAIENGIPESKIFIENESTITLTNLSHAKRIMDSHNFHSALIVTDPLHMKRSVKMARKLKINCLPSPTPTTMYRSKSTKLKSLIYESFFYSLGIIQGYF